MMTLRQPFLRNAWYMAGWIRDFPAGSIKALSLLDEPLVAYRGEDGRLAILEDRCCHRLAPLSRGRIEGSDLRCLYHGLKFAADGHCNDIPGHKTIPQSMKVRSYPVVERYSAAFVWMGDPAKADEALIPPFVGIDDPAWYMSPGRMDYNVNYELIQDNLLDLSHITFVHRNSFGGGNEASNKAWWDGEMRVREIPRGVRVERWMRNAPTPPHQVSYAGPLCDVISAFNYLAPGYFLLTTSNYMAGTLEKAGKEWPEDEPIFSSFTAQAVTPLTSRTTSYFFAFGPWSKVEGNPDAHRRMFFDLGEQAFNEDREILTEQQRIIDADPQRQMILFDVDRAPVLYRRMVQKLLQQESTEVAA